MNYNDAKLKGNEAFKAGDLKEAIALYSKAILVAESPTDEAVARNNRSVAFLKLGRVEPAIEDAATATKLDSKNAKAFLRFGAALAAHHRFDESDAAFAKARELDESLASAAKERKRPKVLPMTLDELHEEFRSAQRSQYAVGSEQLGMRIEALGWISNAKPQDDLAIEARLFAAIALWGERKYALLKGLEREEHIVFPYTRALRVLNRAPELVNESIQIGNRIVPMEEQLQSTLTNLAVAAVTICLQYGSSISTTLQEELELILTAKEERPVIHRFLAAWIMSVSTRKNEAECIRYHKIIDLVGHEAFFLSMDSIKPRYKDITTDSREYLKSRGLK